MRDRMTKLLLVAIALALWGLLLKSLLAPAPVEAQGKAAKEVRAQKFELVDAEGRTRALLAIVKDGPSLALYDKHGKRRAALDMLGDGPRLHLQDKDGKVRAMLFLESDGRPMLHLFDKDEEPRAMLFLESDGGPMLDLLDRGGKMRAALAVLRDRPALSLFDKKGKVIWEAPPG